MARQWVAIAVAAILWMGGAATADDDPAADLLGGGELHDLWLHVNARDWELLRERYMENTYYPCDLEWRGHKATNAGCRSRGGGSRNGSKLGLRVDFNRYVTGQRFLGLTSLVLDNLWQDPSMVRERVSMQLMDRMGLPVPRESYARLFVGSGRDFAGLYAVVEDVDKVFLRRRFGEDEGYLYEYRWIDDYFLQDLGADLDAYAARFEPRTHETASAFTLFAPIRELVRAVNEAEPSTLEAALAPHLDLPLLITQLAAENFLSEWDGFLGYAGLSNFYLYRSSGNGVARVIPWDKDNTFKTLDRQPWEGFDANVLARKVKADPRLRQLYLQRLLEAATLGESLEADVAAAYAQIRPAALADPLKPVSNAEFEQAAADARAFARQRPAVVRAFVSGTAPSRYRPARRPE